MKRALSKKELEALTDNFASDVEFEEDDPFASSDDSGDSDFIPDEECNLSKSESENESGEDEVYINIYSEKEVEVMEGTLGERVVNKLISTIQEKNVVLAFDRFFTNVKLLNEISFPAVGTAMKGRKNMPVINKKLNRGESKFVCNESSIICAKWQDTKEVMLLINCHTDALTTVQIKSKVDTKIDISCPEAIEFYNNCMGGIDLGDQMAGLYDLDRKKKTSFVEFLATLREDLVLLGRQATAVKTQRRLSGRPSKRSRTMINVGDHLPIVQKARRRCQVDEISDNEHTDNENIDRDASLNLDIAGTVEIKYSVAEPDEPEVPEVSMEVEVESEEPPTKRFKTLHKKSPPMELFWVFFDQEMMDMMIDQCNVYANQNNAQLALKEQELKRFLGNLF
ncbi:hypothetical protein ILUMI_11434 [Ignelater luminosus]|uniref:PiggyBac transposable element-derived protein domain-containing protein n=1 Tax=Ignelater luminosus TaxID=2038154 RepID=A0A8K0CYF1_IGNLU|nr:hypothetical protein ILUMI_11434 [Ignelater luminosus]